MLVFYCERKGILGRRNGTFAQQNETLVRRNGTLGCGIESFTSHSKNYDETSKTFHVCEEAM